MIARPVSDARRAGQRFDEDGPSVQSAEHYSELFELDHTHDQLTQAYTDGTIDELFIAWSDKQLSAGRVSFAEYMKYNYIGEWQL